MVHDQNEDPWIVTVTCLLAVLGVVFLRAGLSLDYRWWFAAYVAMGMTASIRRTSAGNGFSVWSGIRGIACLIIGLYAIQRLGYFGISYHTAALVPGDLIEAFDRVKDR